MIISYNILVSAIMFYIIILITIIMLYQMFSLSNTTKLIIIKSRNTNQLTDLVMWDHTVYHTTTSATTSLRLSCKLTGNQFITATFLTETSSKNLTRTHMPSVSFSKIFDYVVPCSFLSPLKPSPFQ